ncbi:MAG: roadblock/LC7 domain-containing protein [Candidatus Hodarchaeota archaeon]
MSTVQETSQKMQDALTDLLKCDQHVNLVLLGDRTGLTITKVSRLLAAQMMGVRVDLESLGAIASAVFCGAEEQGNTLTLGMLRNMTAEFRDGKILTAATGSGGIICVVAGGDAQIGIIRVQMGKTAKRLSGILREFLALDVTPTVEAGDDLLDALDELDDF